MISRVEHDRNVMRLTDDSRLHETILSFNLFEKKNYYRRNSNDFFRCVIWIERRDFITGYIEDFLLERKHVALMISIFLINIQIKRAMNHLVVVCASHVVAPSICQNCN